MTIAYCAPGQRVLAALQLLVEGETAEEIRETSMVDPGTIVLATDYDFPLPPFDFSHEPYRRSRRSATPGMINFRPGITSI